MAGNCKPTDRTPGDVAVLGTGSAGMKHLAALARIPDIRPIAIPTRPERKNDLESAGYRTVADLEAAAGAGVSRCIIASDTGRHFRDGTRALERGMDILVEKPLCIDAEQARRLLRVAEDNGGDIYVGCVLRFSESLNTFKDLLRKIGSLHSFRVECGSYLPDWRHTSDYRRSYSARDEEGGVLRDLVHEVDYASWILGWPKAVYARLRNLGRLGIEAEETADLIWETAGGCLVSMSLDYLSKPPRRRMRATGERGILEWDGIENTVSLTTADGPAGSKDSSQTREEMFLEQDRAFINLTNGFREPRLATGEEGVKVLAICDAGRRSSHCRKEEPVEYS